MVFLQKPKTGVLQCHYFIVGALENTHCLKLQIYTLLFQNM